MSTIQIQKLAVKNFRNLEFDNIEFSNKINCIFGQNGNGKTNLLEALYILFTHKSFRKKATFTQILSMDADQAEIDISSVLKIDEQLSSYSGKWTAQGQLWYLNNEICKKKLDQVVLFVNPYDAIQFFQIPSFRRDWVNQHLAYYCIDFKRDFKNYNKLLKMKNSLLSQEQCAHTELKVVNKKISELNYQLIGKKKEILCQLNEHISATFKLIFDEFHQLELILNSKFIDLSALEIEDRLNENLAKEHIVGHSLYGVHRDDYEFKFNGLNAFDYCSLGQQKMSYLSLLFAYTELFRYKFRTYPIIFVDDVSGELDNLRWQRLIGFLEDKDFQVFITTANDGFREVLEKLDKANKIYIQDGLINTPS